MNQATHTDTEWDRVPAVTLDASTEQTKRPNTPASAGAPQGGGKTKYPRKRGRPTRGGKSYNKFKTKILQKFENHKINFTFLA